MSLSNLLDIFYWDQGSFTNYLHPSMNLRIGPWISMIEVDYNPSPWAPLIVIDLNPSLLAANHHLVEALPFNMVERKKKMIYTHPFMVERHGLLALTHPFVVERKWHGIDNIYKHTSGVSPFYWNAQSSWSETLNLKNAGFSTCVELSPELCKSYHTFSEYVDLKLHKIWLHLRSSPLLELYVRAFLAFLRLFTIITQRDLLSVKCQELDLKLKRNILTCHDFATLMNRIGGCSTTLNFAYYIVYLIIFHHMAALHYLKFSIKITKNWCIMILALSVVFFLELDLPGFKPTQSFKQYNDLVIENKILGGGPTGIFSAEKLSSFAINEVNPDGIYKYSDYVPESEVYTLHNIKSPTLLCKMPLTEFISQLSIPNLKFIAQCHNITIHSKSKSLEIQSIIESHKCKSCKEYIEIFEFIDEKDKTEKKKAINLNKSKKYQEKSPEKYKASHLEAVKKHQQKSLEKCKVSNLEAVKKHQEKSPEKYKASHLEAVKKHQEKSPEKYKASHLEAVKKHQEKSPEKYKASNLEAVKKHQEKSPEKYKASNLEAVKKHQEKSPEKYKASNLEAVKKHQEKSAEKYKASNLEAVKKYQNKSLNPEFPPSAPSIKLMHQIFTDFCKDINPNQFEESGCAVCGQLTPSSALKKLSEMNLNLDILIQEGVTQVERQSSKDPLSDIEGPVLDSDLDSICQTCYKSVSKGKMPLLALANGKWIGKVPPQLLDLSFAEQLLVARVRHNRCLVRVSSGMHKMRANAISFSNPTPKIYDILPPPIEEMDEVLAFIYTGPCKPTKSDFERTPLLVRHKKVAAALEWLRLNHCDYFDLEISYENLKEYPENSPPVVVDYRESSSNKDPESTAINDIEEETGTETG